MGTHGLIADRHYLRILHIINTLSIGGAQSVLVQLLENWGDNSDQQMVISLRQREEFSGRIEALNIPVEHLNLQPGHIEPLIFMRLIRIIKAFKPDIVQTWLYHADLIGSLAAQLACRAPILWGVHHTLTDGQSVKASTWYVVKLLSLLSTVLPSHIICCSRSAYQTHAALGYAKNKMSVILNGVDTDRFHPDPSAREQLLKKLGLSRREKLIGMFARFHPQKDHETFILSAGVLLKTNPDVHFVLAGEGIDNTNGRINSWISRLNIQNNFHLLGSRQDMPCLNAGMDIVTLSSAYGEALPMTLCEAMACGTPCVATDVGDTAVLLGSAGRVVPPGDSQALANAWQAVLQLPDFEYNALSNQARHRILEDYNLVEMINSYKFTYQKAKAI